MIEFLSDLAHEGTDDLSMRNTYSGRHKLTLNFQYSEKLTIFILLLSAAKSGLVLKRKASYLRDCRFIFYKNVFYMINGQIKILFLLENVISSNIEKMFSWMNPPQIWRLKLSLNNDPSIVLRVQFLFCQIIQLWMYPKMTKIRPNLSISLNFYIVKPWYSKFNNSVKKVFQF